MAAVTLRNAPWPLLLLLTYTLSGSCNHFLTLIMHEVAHNLAFKVRSRGTKRARQARALMAPISPRPTD